MRSFGGNINFVITQSDLWPELYAPEYALGVDEIPDEKLGSVEVCWVAQTYIKLRREGWQVSLKDHFVPGEICIVSAGELFSTMDVVKQSYVIAIRGDCSRSFISHLTINQNKFGCKFNHEYFIPHWPQPSITPREESRKNQIFRISFKGAHLPSTFKSTSFNESLLQLGVTFEVEEKSKGGYNWRDYSKVDLVLAVRDFYGVTKPASKLVNAWLAGVPALLGPEPAFRELKRDNLDYLEVQSESDAITAVKWLIDNPEVYQEMRKRCVERAQDYSESHYIELWKFFLLGDVKKGYSAWVRCSPRRKKLIYYRNLLLQQLQWKKESIGATLFSRIKKGRVWIEVFFLR